MKYQGKRPDQVEFSERASAYAFIAFIVLAFLWSILF